MELVQDTESLVRLTSANSASDGEGGVEEKKEEVGDEVVGKCEEVRSNMNVTKGCVSAGVSK